jgi:hypothetical protein
MAFGITFWIWLVIYLLLIGLGIQVNVAGVLATGIEYSGAVGIIFQNYRWRRQRWLMQARATAR